VSYDWVESEEILRFRVLQVQDTSKGIPIYQIPVQIGITTPGGKVTEKVWLTQKEEVFEFRVEERPLFVRFDEGNFLLKEWTFEKSRAELLYQLENDDVIGREWAAGQLGRFPQDSVITDALTERAQDDRFWAVRLGALRALDRIGGAGDAGLIKEICLDEHSRVRTAALRILGNSGDQSHVSFFRERFNSDDSYVAQAETLRGIGRCGDRSQLRFLRRAAMMESPRNVIRRAAEEAIAEISGEEEKER
jgi:aminopeptidase N